MMRHRFSLLVVLALVLVAGGLAARAQTTTPTLRLETDFTVEPTAQIRLVKFPHTAAQGNRVYVSANGRGLDANFWDKADSADTFPAVERLGNATGQPDFSSTAVTVGADGAVYYVWIDRPNEDNELQDRIYLRKRAPGATAFNPQAPVSTQNDREFDIAPEVAVLSNNTIVVAWRAADRPARYSVSTDGGASWSAPTLLSLRTGDFALYFPALAAGPNNSAAIATSYDDNGQLQVFGGVLSGSSFSFGPISDRNQGEFSDPSLTIAPNGRIYAVYRRLSDQPESSGVFLAEFVGGAWQQRQVVANAVIYTSYICADPQSNLHLAWLAQVSGRPKLFYSFQPVDGQFVGTPVEVPFANGDVFNGRLSCNVDEAAGKAYAHFVGEYFEGDSSFLRYYRLSASVQVVAPGPRAIPVLAGGAEYIGGDDTVSVSFQQIEGAPARVRWRWNAPPDDQASDSNGYQPFANPIDIPVPETIRSDLSCREHRLYVQLANAENTAGPPASDAVKVDPEVTALVAVTNPYLQRKRSIFDQPALADFAGDGGASDGDPGYTRAPIFYLELATPNECSGLKDIATGRTITSIRPAVPVTNNRFANIVPFPGAFGSGSNSVVVRVSDKAGNVSDVTRSLIYDDRAPVLESGGSLSLTTPLPQATLLATLEFSNISVSDDVYPGSGFWGVWIANSRNSVSDPLNDDTLVWSPLAAPGASGAFSVARWSLATGLAPDQVTPGDYYVYVRFLDGAGNPTTRFLSASTNLAQITLPASHIPLVLK